MPPSLAAASVAVDIVPPALAGLHVQPQLSLAAQVANVVNVSQPTGAPMHASVLPQVQLWLVAQPGEFVNDEQGFGVPVQLPSNVAQ
jgi:hypothetical protein